MPDFNPDQEAKFELVRAKSLDEVEDEKITVVGPDLKDVKEGRSIPLGIYIEVAGKGVEEEHQDH